MNTASPIPFPTTMTTFQVTEPKRIMKREWKRNKLYMQKSTSLPVLQLHPDDRALFTCQNCGFSNGYIPVCLWCSWTSPSATKEFEASIPRPRRASAPTKIVWKEDTPSSALRNKASKPQQSRFVSPSWTPLRPASPLSRITAALTKGTLRLGPRKRDHHTTESRATDGDKRSAKTAQQVTSNRGIAFTTEIQEEGEAVHESNVGDFVVVPEGTLENVSTATSPIPITCPIPTGSQRGAWNSFAAKANPFRARTPIPVELFTASEHNTTPKGVERPEPPSLNRMTGPPTKAPCSSCVTPIIVDLNDLDDLDILSPRKTKNKSPIAHANAPPSAYRTLRRRKRIPIFRASSPAATSAPEDPIGVPVPPRPLSQPFVTHTHSPHYLPLAFPPLADMSPYMYNQPPTPSAVRIGHPNRPYYSAIRKNVPRPTSPNNGQSPVASPPSSPSMSIASFASNPVLTSHTSPPNGSHSTGFVLMQHQCFIDVPFDDDDLDDGHSAESCIPYPLLRHNAHSSRNFTATPAPSAFSRSEHPLRLGFTSPVRGTAAIHGCSVSGETELRMALARGGGLVAADEGSSHYRFRDMNHDHGLMDRVRRLRRGLRELVPRRH